eukprot:c3555_g1_i1.p1 GENE.c3555_g1_i1~~c3555_g1_i1.p1  ORF type:complete len:337 (+),score=34.72 c3555_g1_i1:92-1102(+)
MSSSGVHEARRMVGTSNVVHEARRLVGCLLTAISAPSEREMLKISLELFNFFHFQRPDYADRALSCAHAGAISALLTVARDATGRTTKTQALRTLGQMCCFNEWVSSSTAGCSLFISTVDKLLGQEDDVVCETFYLLNVVAADSWRSHPCVIRFLPASIRILNEPSNWTDQTQGNCCRFIGQLAYNEANDEVLLKADAVPSLIRVMTSMNVSLGCISAVIAISNLMKGTDVRRLCGDCDNHLIDITMQALRRTLRNQDFPEGSSVFFDDWKIMIGVSNLVRSRENCVILRQHGVMQYVCIALTKPNADRRLRKFALLSLWRLESHNLDAPVTAAQP